MNKISFCTVCMNRLFHVRETLPVNIQENIDYPNIEFVLLDYNSADGLEQWVRSNMMHYIESGILKYYRTTDPAYFSMSHSKNMVSWLSSGNILCMIDGDNYAGVNYAHWINAVFAQKGNNSVVSAFTAQGKLRYVDTGGKITFSRHLFAVARGFDESFVGYGMDDRDLLIRLEKAGGIPVSIEDEAFIRFIEHSHMERLNNYYLVNNLESLYVQPAGFTPPITALYIMKDGSFYEVIYKYDEKFSNEWHYTFGGWHVEKNGYKKGNFDPVKFEDTRSAWQKIENSHDYYVILIKGFSECHNRIRYTMNNENNEMVNPEGWGKGTVYLNFDYTTPIYCGENSVSHSSLCK